jgi:hypothetical protein
MTGLASRHWARLVEVSTPEPLQLPIDSRIILSEPDSLVCGAIANKPGYFGVNHTAIDLASTAVFEYSSDLSEMYQLLFQNVEDYVFDMRCLLVLFGECTTEFQRWWLPDTPPFMCESENVYFELYRHVYFESKVLSKKLRLFEEFDSTLSSKNNFWSNGWEDKYFDLRANVRLNFEWNESNWNQRVTTLFPKHSDG